MIQQYTPEDMPDVIKFQILAFMRMEWPQGFIGRFRGRRFISRPEFHPRHFVIEDNGFVVGHAERISRTWEHNKIHYTVYGISGVFVYPDYRGEGYGKQLIQSITADIANQPDADLGMLWCETHLCEFYAQCGWQPMENTVTLLGDTESAAQVHDEEVLCMTFFSNHAKNHRPDFDHANIYFGWTTW